MFRSIYNFFKHMKTPAWLKKLLGEIQMLIWQVTLSIGKEYIADLKGKIIEVAALEIPNDEKFDKVWDYARKELMLTVKDRYLNLIIEALLNYLKEKKII